MSIKIHSWNEWDTLKSVIIGDATNARVPKDDISLRAINYADDVQQVIPSGPYPEKVIVEANEDLETLCNTLRQLGVTVHRPRIQETQELIQTAHWSTDRYYSYCPRDSVLVIGDQIIPSPMPIRARSQESLIYSAIFENSDGKLSPAPSAKLLDSLYQIDSINKDTLTLTEAEPCFDAANVLRCGYDLFYLVSNSGNVSGGEWLQKTLGEKFKVHFLKNIYAYMHLDSTISFLRPGLVLLNPSRINEHNLPECLKSWDKIWCPPPVDIGFQAPYKNASTWIGMNLLMVNPHLAIVEYSQKELIRTLEKNKIEVIPLPIRHARTLGGAFHCVSLDLHREGSLEKYF
jgi:scyllo-inosamine-4-phosphate amidinotransferase 1